MNSFYSHRVYYTLVNSPVTCSTFSRRHCKMTPFAEFFSANKDLLYI